MPQEFSTQSCSGRHCSTGSACKVHTILNIQLLLATIIADFDEPVYEELEQSGTAALDRTAEVHAGDQETGPESPPKLPNLNECEEPSYLSMRQQLRTRPGDQVAVTCIVEHHWLGCCHHGLHIRQEPAGQDGLQGIQDS